MIFLQKNSLGEEWVRCGIQDSVHETVRQGLLLRLQCSEKCLVDNMDDNGTQKLLLLIRFGSVQCPGSWFGFADSMNMRRIASSEAVKALPLCDFVETPIISRRMDHHLKTRVPECQRSFKQYFTSTMISRAWTTHSGENLRRTPPSPVVRSY